MVLMFRLSSTNWYPGQAQNMTAGANYGFDPTSYQSYMDPYMNDVIQQQYQDIQRQGDIAKQGANAQAVGSGAFGGSRQGIQQAEINRNVLDQQARTGSQLRTEGFKQASNSSASSCSTSSTTTCTSWTVWTTSGTSRSNGRASCSKTGSTTTCSSGCSKKSSTTGTSRTIVNNSDKQEQWESKLQQDWLNNNLLKPVNDNKLDNKVQ
jgi:hypothetical protein